MLKPLNKRTVTKAFRRAVPVNMEVCVCASTDQVVIWSNAKEFPEIAKGNWSIGLKAKVTVVMSRSQVTAFTENTSKRAKGH